MSVVRGMTKITSFVVFVVYLILALALESPLAGYSEQQAHAHTHRGHRPAQNDNAAPVIRLPRRSFLFSASLAGPSYVAPRRCPSMPSGRSRGFVWWAESTSIIQRNSRWTMSTVRVLPWKMTNASCRIASRMNVYARWLGVDDAATAGQASGRWA